MEERITLNRDFVLTEKWIRKGNREIGIRTCFIVRTHSVVNATWGAKRRLWGLLPPKETPRIVRHLKIPESVVSGPALIQYLQKEQPRWL